MKIKVWALAFDGNNCGTSSTIYTDEVDVYRDLIDWVIGEDPEDSDRIEALIALDRLDYSRVHELLDNHSESRCATWDIAEKEIDPLEHVPLLKNVLRRSERFISGFEDDPDQKGVRLLLFDLRSLLGVQSPPRNLPDPE